ncbi:MAG: PepSY domain-containing protein [Pleurocapsa sp.]
MNNPMKIILAILLTTTLVSGGLTSLAQADESDRVCEASPQDSAYLKGNRSSRVIIAQGVNDEMEMNEEREMEQEQEFEEDEEQEAARLQPLAKITAEQAKEAALKVQSGEVKELELEAEDGNLVYEVTVGETEVFVDAGNGKVLYTQGINEKIDEATQQSRPRSSIQVPDRDDEG